MGGFAAILAGGTTDGIRDALNRMLEAAAHRAHDGIGSWSDGRFTAGVLRDPVLPEYQPDAHPCVDPASGLVVVFDGRLDNRADLSAAFGWDARASAADDPVYAVEAWRRWGASAPERMLGDFALLAWQSRDGTLFAARDRIGPRPVHWTSTGEGFLVASDVAQLTAATGQVPPPDEEVAALYLACDPPAGIRTLFRGIQRLPAGCVLSLQPGEQPVVREYWRAEAVEERGSIPDDESASECRALLDAAVEARLRARSRVAVFFSGGIDSSAVLASAVARGAPVVAVSQVFDASACDERPYQRDMAAKLHLQVVEVLPDALSPEAFQAQARSRLLLPDSPPDQAGRSLRRAAIQKGASTALTGAGGDYIFGGTTVAYADMLRRGRVAAAVRQSYADWRADATGRDRFGLLRFGVWPLLPEQIRARFRGPARRLARIDDAPPWIRLPRVVPPVVAAPPPGVSWASWALAREFRNGWTPLIMEQSERSASEAGFVERYPLLDARLVSFALALREDQRRRGTIGKFVLRRAVARELPASIATRITKAAFGHLFFEAVDCLGGPGFFSDLRIADAGWVDPSILRRRYDETARLAAAGNHDEAGRAMPALWMAVAMELWFRAAYDATRGDKS